MSVSYLFDYSLVNTDLVQYQNLEGGQGGYGQYNPYGAAAQPNPYAQGNAMEAGNGSYGASDILEKY